MDKKKIIILYSTGGMGHKKAALALFKVLSERKEDVDVEVVDVLEFGNKIYKFLYLDFYVFLMSRARWLWGILYYGSNSAVFDRLTRRLRGALDNKSLPGLADMLAEKDPDALVATHFLLPSIAAILKRDSRFHARMYTVITDYGPHSYWLSDHIDRFFVGSAQAARELSGRGVPEDRIDVTGIPTTDEFSRVFDVEKLRGEYGLKDGKKTIFMMSGGFGVGPIEEMLLSLNSCRGDIQVITVCGHNKEVYEKVRAMEERLKYPLVVLGFTDKVAELMAVSDLMVTKAGGISVTEAMNSRLPMILFASVPGQETWNEIFLTQSGAAVKAGTAAEIPSLADRILLSEQVYGEMRSRIDRIRRPEAAETIADVVINEIRR